MLLYYSPRHHAHYLTLPYLTVDFSLPWRMGDWLWGEILGRANLRLTPWFLFLFFFIFFCLFFFGSFCLRYGTRK